MSLSIKRTFYRQWGLFIVMCLLSSGISAAEAAYIPSIQSLLKSRVFDSYVEPSTNRKESDNKVVSGNTLVLSKAEQKKTTRQLNLHRAVQLAFINNKTILAAYERLGGSEEDLKHSGNWSGPSFMTDSLSPDFKTSRIVSIAQSISDFVMVPSRQRIAASQLQTVNFEIVDMLFQRIQDIKTQYYAYQAAQESVRLVEALYKFDLKEEAWIRKEWKSGKGSELDFVSRRILSDQSKLEWEKSRSRERVARHKLIEIVGVDLNAEGWVISGKDRDLPLAEPSLSLLENTARNRRLDLFILNEQLKTSQLQLAYKKLSRWDGVMLGLQYRKEMGIKETLSPTLTLPIDVLFGASVTDESARIRELELLISAKQIQIISEVRIAFEELVMARAHFEMYQNELLPLYQKKLKLIEHPHKDTVLGFTSFFDAKHNVILAEREVIDSERLYWTKHAELERVVGVELED